MKIEDIDVEAAVASVRQVWWISRRGQPRIIGLLEGLKDSTQPGHQYLDIGDPTGIQIMCSKEEYPSKLP